MNVAFFSPPFLATQLPQFFFLPFSAMPLPQLVSISGRTRISVISLLKFNFLYPLTYCTFSCNFGNTIAEIQSLSSFCQITLNSTYNNNKLHFFAIFSQKTLQKRNYLAPWLILDACHDNLEERILFALCSFPTSQSVKNWK